MPTTYGIGHSAYEHMLYMRPYHIGPYYASLYAGGLYVWAGTCTYRPGTVMFLLSEQLPREGT